MLITHCAGIISTACAGTASWVCQLRILRYGFALQLRPALVIKLISDLWCYALPERRRMFRFHQKTFLFCQAWHSTKPPQAPGPVEGSTIANLLLDDAPRNQRTRQALRYNTIRTLFVYIYYDFQ